MNSTRRNFIKTTAVASFGLALAPNSIAFGNSGRKGYIMTVNGKIKPSDMGLSLTHEHVLVDGSKGATGEIWWDREAVKKVVMPYLHELKKHGCKTFFEFTPSYIGKDVQLLKELADETRLHIITNTGYYGANNNKHIPEHAYNESAEQLASRWITDFETGMQETTIKPGFIKTAVNKGSLSEFHQKLIKAASLTHLKTGLTIASHTGEAEPALQQIEIVKENGVSPSAFIWTHAQKEKDLSMHVKAAEQGAWVSLDSVRKKNAEKYVSMIKNLKESGHIKKILLSHDAGWYTPGAENGGNFRGFTSLFTHLIPALKEAGLTKEEIDTIMIQNPAEAFAISVKKLKK